jgi:SNF2 family DNA or RNA helicase
MFVRDLCSPPLLLQFPAAHTVAELVFYVTEWERMLAALNPAESALKFCMDTLTDKVYPEVRSTGLIVSLYCCLTRTRRLCLTLGACWTRWMSQPVCWWFNLSTLRWAPRRTKTAFVLAFVAAAAAGGHRVLVFSQSRAMLDGIEAAADAAAWRYCRIDGSVPHRRLRSARAAWRASRAMTPSRCSFSPALWAALGSR